MSGGEHTPGPWMAHGPAKPTADAPEGGDYCIQDGGTNVIAETFYRVSEGAGGTRNARANARLIAAAPDMLDALRQWRAAERDGDAAELENARTSRDAAIEAAIGGAP